MPHQLKRPSKWHPFYNLKTLASYHFDLVTVALDSVEDLQLNALKHGATPARNSVLPLAAHEYTHWLDHVGSLWGRRLLATYFRAVVARESQDLRQFPNIVDARRQMALATSHSYFRMQGGGSGARPPWKWSISTGLRFDSLGRQSEDHPLMMVRFSVPSDATDDSDRDLIERMPVSAASLAELRAMNAEGLWIAREAQNLGEKTPADPKRWLAEFQSQVYDPRMLVYTVALHMAANQWKVSLISDALPQAAALAGLALNFPRTLVDRLVTPDQWRARWGGRVQALAAQRDPGFIYAALLSAAPKTDAISDAWIDAVLQSALRTTFDEYRNAVVAEAAEQTTSSGGFDPRLSAWLTAGEEWSNALGPVAMPNLLFEVFDGMKQMPMADSLTADFTIWNPSIPVNTGDDTLGWARIELMEHIRDKIEEFVEVCGV